MLKLQTPSIALARRTYGDQPIMEMLVQMISNVNDFFNVSRPMNAVQIMETAKLISKVYYFLKFEEIKFVFENAKTGTWGKIYERLDGSVILEWFEKYDLQRTHAVEMERVSQNKQINRDPVVVDYAEVKKRLAEIPEKKMKPVNHVRNTHSLEQWFDGVKSGWPEYDRSKKDQILKNLELNNVNGVMQKFIDELNSMPF